MKFFCSPKTLIYSISVVQKAVSSKSTLPILKGIYLEAFDQNLRLVTTDMELGIDHIMDANIIEEGSVVVDARLFSEIIRKLPDSEVEISLKDNNELLIKCDSIEFNILSYNPSEFPELPKIEEEQVYKIPQDLFKDMIRQTVFATAEDGTRPILTGVLVETGEGMLNMVALDGYRVALRKSEIDSQLSDKVVIPGKTLNEINRIMGGGEDKKVQISLTNNHALFTVDSTKLVSRLLEGEFINYNQIIPKEFKSRIKIETKQLLDSIERASLLGKEGRNNLVKLTITDEKMIINSNSELGNVHEEIEIELEGEDLQIAFNSRYFIEALRVVDDDVIYLEFTTNLSPGIIKPISNDNTIYLILPVRLASY
ncbi:MAG TPA: DNA polymerase III subunit beta [Clostridia bacterium]|nr:DNA polymerase III subunit beta [Clostridia bacterium]